jgi:putative hemolysin
VAKFFDLEIPDEDDFDTIGGYVINRLGYIPEDDEFPSVTMGSLLLTVRSMDERRVEKLEVERLPRLAEEETTA